MPLPLELVLVRHGESEGNAARTLSKNGDHSAYEKLRGRHGSRLRLTDRGRRQAELAGEWIRGNIGEVFDRYYVSEYLRAKETAAYLGLAGAEWRSEFYLRERERGQIEMLSEEELREEYAHELERKRLDAFYWRPPGGESMAEVCLRIDRVINTLARDCADQRVIIVCHGEVIWAFRIRLERLAASRFLELDREEHIHNCQVFHYTRRSPETGELSGRVDWMRRAWPEDPEKYPGAWERIVRERPDNTGLLAEVEETEQVIS